MSVLGFYDLTSLGPGSQLTSFPSDLAMVTGLTGIISWHVIPFNRTGKDGRTESSLFLVCVQVLDSSRMTFKKAWVFSKNPNGRFFNFTVIDST